MVLINFYIEELKVYNSVGEMPPEMVRKLLLLKGPDNKWFNLKENRDFGHYLIKIEYYWRSLVFLFEANSFKYMIFYLIRFYSVLFYCKLCYYVLFYYNLL